MYQASIHQPGAHRRLQIDRLGVVTGRVVDTVLQGSREMDYARQDRLGLPASVTASPGYQLPPVTIHIQWTPQFTMAYQQFISGGAGGTGGMSGIGGMGGMRGMSRYSLGTSGGMGTYGGFGGRSPAVTYGFGLTTN